MARLFCHSCFLTSRLIYYFNAQIFFLLVLLAASASDSVPAPFQFRTASVPLSAFKAHSKNANNPKLSFLWNLLAFSFSVLYFFFVVFLSFFDISAGEVTCARHIDNCLFVSMYAYVSVFVGVRVCVIVYYDNYYYYIPVSTFILMLKNQLNQLSIVLG